MTILSFLWIGGVLAWIGGGSIRWCIAGPGKIVGGLLVAGLLLDGCWLACLLAC